MRVQEDRVMYKWVGVKELLTTSERKFFMSISSEVVKMQQNKKGP